MSRQVSVSYHDNQTATTHLVLWVSLVVARSRAWWRHQGVLQTQVGGCQRVALYCYLSVLLELSQVVIGQRLDLSHDGLEGALQSNPEHGMVRCCTQVYPVLLTVTSDCHTPHVQLLEIAQHSVPRDNKTHSVLRNYVIKPASRNNVQLLETTQQSVLRDTNNTFNIKFLETTHV